MTTMPSISTESSAKRMALTAAWSAAILSPLPIQRAEDRAAASVTRTSSKARFRSRLAGTSPERRSSASIVLYLLLMNALAAGRCASSSARAGARRTTDASRDDGAGDDDAGDDDAGDDDGR